MKYLYFLCLPLVLSGCALTDLGSEKQEHGDDTLLTQSASLETCDKVHEATSKDADADTDAQELAEPCVDSQEGVAQIIHPTETVKVPLPVDEAKSIAPEQDLWVYIGNNLSLEIPKSQPRLVSQKKWYLRHPTYMKIVSQRAEPFLYYIVQELKANDIPLDIALLPIVESSFDPFAYSSGKAAGLWQFIPGTGKRFGMPQNWWYDGRRDVVASTQGAIDYLKYLHKMFDGNWLHALAAYNSGEGRVQRAIRKNKRAGKSTDFWALDLPKETRAYVPKLLALADMLKNPDTYDFKWPSIDNSPVIEVVDIGSQIDLAMAAQMANLDLAELQALNPGFNQWATDPQGPHRLVLPIDKAQSFSLALNKTSEKERLNWERHQVRSGDSIGKIAKQYNTNIDVIKRINGLNSNTIYAGDHLLVPVALGDLGDYSLSAAQKVYHPSRSQSKQGKITHTISAGDTLWDIANQYDVSVKQIASWNRMSTRDTLTLGRTLNIYQKAQNVAGTRSVTYNVRKGDSLSLIASRFKVKVKDILKWNSLSKNNYLQPGQRLKLLVDITKT